ncbi:Hsp20/alpha crystallin family protein [Actinomycetospora sp. NBRC 106378]|uniref:Hsp20/alpha crystallin family protein n=1 Tax=Actinomycetospora sp. NBRC 106378 TaxID=3032208 RepID=UPI0024A11FFF|nr:Hsp20/alpha crystallin family protein [Actinomycetospora sp. NBRC 106378]GLZ53004.1 heat shock protein Hsp20 [Actinomycetospora sp. NBRC 106378]
MSSALIRYPRFVGPFGPFRVADALVRGTFGTPRQAESAWYVPAADVVRDGDDAVVRVELPGVDLASDVTVEVVEHRLVIAGERREEHEGQGFRESRRGAFRRSFGLPRHVGADAVSASYDAGVLSVRVAGAHVAPQPVTPASRRIEIAGVAPAADATADETPAEGASTEA